ncbi:hypothetical protein CHS0354_042406 [Potamilus streckersoni]|uniref:Uncharacterized protein n=1 Tax=Potamilus streckersoni TaxID=2493646 RepID=A0AAE0SU76_9BIVA|nr:hypothetical protein CHS0354_042406 [Potamilus streckersoni]
MRIMDIVTRISVLLLCCEICQAKGRVYVAEIGKPSTLSFELYDRNMSSIKIDNPTSKLTQPILLYNAINDSCTYTDVVSVEKINIQTCVLRKGEFSFIISEIRWLHKGSYFAWDDKGRLLDSLYLDIQEPTMTKYVMTTWSLDIGKEKEILLIITALGVTIFAVCLVVFAVWKLRIRKARRSLVHNFTYGNGFQTISHCSGNAFIPEETRIISTKINSRNLTEFELNRMQTRIKYNEQNMSVREMGCANSSGKTRCNWHIDSSLSSAETIQSESAHGYEYVHDYDELASDCRSKQPYIRSKLLGTNSSGSTSQSSCEYSYVVQRKFLTLRPPAPDPVRKKKNKKQNVIGDSFYSVKKFNKGSLPRDDLSILYTKRNNQRTMKSHSTRSSHELSLDFINEVPSPSFVQVEKDFTKKAVESPRKSREVKCLNSKILKPEVPLSARVLTIL